MKDNKSLKRIYDKAYNSMNEDGVTYGKGQNNFFTFSTEDITKEVLREINYENLSVLEIGCGTGETAFGLLEKGAKKVVAYDYSSEAISIAKSNYSDKNLSFENKSIDDVFGIYDCIIMQEVIEHTDNPFEVIKKLILHLDTGGHLILTCPSFANLRGIVWMTLQVLLDVPMSLTDKHFFVPDDMIRYSKKLDIDLKWRTFRHSQSHGEMMIYDMDKRLTNALRDAKLENNKVPVLLNWLEGLGKYMEEEDYNGSKALYRFTKK